MTRAPRRARGRSRRAHLRGPGERLAHAAARRRRGRAHPGGRGQPAGCPSRTAPARDAAVSSPFGAAPGWLETRTAKDTPCFELPGGGALTFEPGGQLEYSSPPCGSPSAACWPCCARGAAAPRGGRERGDRPAHRRPRPANSAGAAPLLLHTGATPGWRSTWPAGPRAARMMRQTAAFQVALDLDDEPWLRWRVLNAAAPYVTAIFANSPLYDGEHTGYQSTRAAVWRALDPARTGFPGRTRSGRRLSGFCAGRPGHALPQIDGEYRPFGEWLRRAGRPRRSGTEHLSTLFPEVRPRGHWSCGRATRCRPSGMRPRSRSWSGSYDPGAARRRRPARPPDLGLLERAGQARLPIPHRGLPRICRTSRSRAARTSARAISIPPIWSRPASSSTATPAGAALRRTTSKARRSRRRSSSV